ncbi:hypothetical protein HYV49_04015 [Candidatus Pacearchaeota archaeon]|nr:hypothetical protein [Candidatus Pacearchaeota archaeon]
MDNKIFMSVIAVTLMSAIVLTLVIPGPASISTVFPVVSSGINYRAYVCIYKNGELQECSHNLLYNAGKNITRDLLGGGSSGTIRNITLCNASAGTTSCAAPIADASESFVEYNGCGLTSATGTYNTINSNDGNWSIVATFTSSCDNRITNVTRLKNATGGLFASNTFTSVTLQTNDQLTVNWTISVV